jgi:hypothetical protein
MMRAHFVNNTKLTLAHGHALLNLNHSVVINVMILIMSVVIYEPLLYSRVPLGI